MTAAAQRRLSLGALSACLVACPIVPKPGADSDSAPKDTLSADDSDEGTDTTDTIDTDTGSPPDSAETGESGGDDSSSDTADSEAEDTSWGLEDADAKIIGVEEGDMVGFVLSAAGDNNGDGLADMAVQTYGSPDTITVVHSPIEGTYRVDEAAGRVRVERDEVEGVGLSTEYAPLVGDGDTNNDGYSDLLIGMPYAGDSYLGWVWVVSGPTVEEQDLNVADAGIQGNADEGMTGIGIAWGGDIDGDGFEDILVGVGGANAAGVESDLGSCGSEEDLEADFDLDAGMNVGAVYVVPGPTSGESTLSEVASARWYGEDGGDSASSPIAGASDLDGDGWVDMVVAALGQCERGVGSGAIYVVLGPVTSDGALSDADGKRSGERAGDRAGESLTVAGDVNADGYADILIGSPEKDSLKGKIWLELGPVTGSQPLTLADASFTGEANGDYAGYALSSAGDQDEDGYDDFLIGAPTAETAASVNGGIAYLIFGPVTGAQSLADAETRLSDSALDNSAGKSLANLGDTDADGRTDLLIGAYRDGDGAYAGGAAYLLLGGGALLTHAMSE